MRYDQCTYIYVWSILYVMWVSVYNVFPANESTTNDELTAKTTKMDFLSLLQTRSMKEHILYYVVVLKKCFYYYLYTSQTLIGLLYEQSFFLPSFLPSFVYVSTSQWPLYRQVRGEEQLLIIQYIMISCKLCKFLHGVKLHRPCLI